METEALLDDVETRVLGALIEKQITTPDYYPLTLNSLTAACNQKSNRHPVVSFDEKSVVRALDSLLDKQLARRVSGAEMRVPKYYHLFTEYFAFTGGGRALRAHAAGAADGGRDPRAQQPAF